MTREQAIEIIKKEYACVDADCDIERSCGKCELMMPTKEPILQAYEMAIQALSQEPCDDTVSIRNDVLKCRVGKLVVYNVEWLKKHWQMEMDIVCGVKPCDDAISRIEVMNVISDFVTFEKYIDKHNHITFEPLEQMINSLPTVTQKSETETWNGIHAQITAPKGTFDRIFNDADDDEDDI